MPEIYDSFSKALDNNQNVYLSKKDQLKINILDAYKLQQKQRKQSQLITEYSKEYYNKIVASNDKTKYYLLYKGEFAYNKSYSNGYPYGAFKRLKQHDKGIVSPLYICFKAKNDTVSSEYYEQFFESRFFDKQIHKISQEGARDHGILNLSINDLF
ncbi:MAG: hypothetical protein ACOCP8_08745, partial [archaeon]